MTLKKQNTQKQGRRLSSTARFRIVTWTVILLFAGIGISIWWFTRPGQEADNPDVVVNLKSMVGKPAPAFRLSDSEGKEYTVTPGNGRPIVLIFHMGSV